MAITYKIGEAATLLNLKTYVLRFWETEFPDIAPLRTDKGQRLYTRDHVALLERIRFLLHERGLTISGARRALEEEKARGVVYVFGAPGALAPGASGGEPLSGLPDTFEPEALSAGQEAAPAGLVPHPAVPLPAAAEAEKKRGQCSLPGLDELMALRARIFDVPASFEEDGEEASGVCAATPSRQAPQGMLPLFAVARAGCPAVPEGGRNFIPAGTSAPPAGAAAPRAGGGSSPAPAFTADFLSGVAEELEQIAALLRGGTREHPIGEDAP